MEIDYQSSTDKRNGKGVLGCGSCMTNWVSTIASNVEDCELIDEILRLEDQVKEWKKIALDYKMDWINECHMRRLEEIDGELGGGLSQARWDASSPY